ncbi:PRC-barrel domain containing protein [Dyella monticola]|uniref:PRC-barrel domain containing protein n=1 Tax=Dyella monticola TaxID=1927958 RepID=A0A370WSF7_9GAMM|nr:PRC-barrel domain-containing protein [Dyella monticola]RDS78946.1 PRC-barrel domain containing protein [Dyella monticola]
MATPHLLSVLTLTGEPIKDLTGDPIGELKDFMIDTTNGRIAYGVLSFGGLLGMGEKLFAVPWEAIQLDEKNKQLLLDVDKERLKAAPGFDKDHWPNFTDSSFTARVRAYFQH